MLRVDSSQEPIMNTAAVQARLPQWYTRRDENEASQAAG